uniref:Cyclic nucleotide-binding domain-containing protein n=1 Tax=Hyaloperonospora arabidopsidis (strain Emoy2) TaxID=559515 RepID=M4B5R5_HYAAE
MASRPDATHDPNERRVRRLLRALSLDTGDVLLFDRKCSSMGVYGGAICVCAKLLGQTHWDHTGVIVRISSEEKSSEEKSGQEEEELFVLEAALTGVKLRPLVARVLRSGGHDVAVRKLQFARTIEVQARGQEFALSVVNAPYEDQMTRLFNAGVSVPTRIARERLFAAFVAAKQELSRLDVELLHRDKMSVFEKEALRQEREAVQKRYGQLGAALRGKERSVFENAVEKQATKMFCSQLVAGFYQHLGLLLPYPSANSYLPKHFSAREGGEFLKLQQGASFLPEISLRKELETETKRYVTREQERKDRDPCAASETAAIVHCLRRHQLFHTLSEPELLAAAAQFRRRVLTRGEVVFHQGTLGDCFYIIERGHCDVFVDYDHPVKTNAVLHAADTDSVSDLELQQRTELRRHKTIVLPEFKSSSSRVGKNERVHVATNGPGNAFGASALIYDTPRRATLQASYSEPEDDEEAVVLWQLDKRAFCEILARHPGTQRSLEECRFLLETLEDHPLFAELDDRAKALAVRKCFPLSVRAGTTILRQGDPGDYFYLVESGRCEVSRCKPKVTNPFVDRVIGRGASFGEAALLYNSRRGASVKALDDAKIWCMDRASFLTITRSGSAALHKLFSKVGTTVVSGSNESFATERDLRRMLTDPQQMQLIRHCDTKDDDDDDDEEFGEMAALSVPLPSAQSYNRAVQLALSVLLNDSSGLVNFSQFAHFHIALGASNIDQLLPEAAFRVLKSVADTYHEGDTRVPMPSTSPFLFDPVGPDQATIKLNDLSRAIRQWLSTGETAGDAYDTPETTVRLTPGRLAFYERLFDLPAHQFGDQYVTHDDLVRGITAFEMEDAQSGSKEDDDDAGLDDVVAAKVEFRAFLAALKSDISALRTIWRAAKLQAHGGDNAGKLDGRQKLTFDANLKSGWISALRVNPTGSDWEYLQPVMEDEYQSAAYNDTSATTHGKQLTAQITSFAAAIAAGALARTVCAPLERLKMLMQLSIPKPMPAATTAMTATAKPTSIIAPYTSLTRGVLNMVKLSGLRSLFSGNLAHCIWVVPLVPTKFVLCRIYQDQVGRLLPGSSSPSGATEVRRPLVSATAANLAMGGLAGLTLNCLFYPLDVIRGRLTVQQYYNANRPSRGIIDCARSIRDKAGLRGFYQGFAPASLGVATSIGCSFAFYESLRPIFVLYDTEDTRNQLGRPSVPGQIMCATTASLASQCIAYPFDVIRRRVQLQGTKWHPELAFSTYKSAWHCVKASVQEDGGGVRGLRSLYRGMFVNAVKALPPTVISFLSYEKLWEMEHSAEDA